MTEFLLYEAKAGVLLAVFYLFYRILLGKVTLYSLRRWVLVASLLGAFLLPLFHITIHISGSVSSPAATALPTPAEGLQAMGEAAPRAGGTFPWEGALIAIILAGGLFTALRALKSSAKIIGIMRRSHRFTSADGTTVLVTEENTQPFSWLGHIVMGRKDFERSDGHILLHEKSHIRHLHSLDNLLVALGACFQWFNPVIWLYRKEVSAVHEFQADSDVLRSGADPREYQYSLIEKAALSNGYAISDFYSHSTLKNRIAMMSMKKSPARSALRALYMLPLLGAALTLSARTVIDLPTEIEDGPLSSFITLNEITVVSYDITPEAVPLPYQAASHAIPQRVTAASEVDKMPVFDGKEDLGAFSAWANMQIMRPKGCNHTGKAEVEFIVEADGSVSAIEVTGGICPEIGRQLSSVVGKSSSKWTPAKKGGSAVATMLVLPVQFIQRGAKREESPAQGSQETKASFQGGGLTEFSEWFNDNMRYPKEAADNGIEGRVVLSFTIDEKGRLTDEKVVRGADPVLDGEALRTVRLSPLWTPATKDGKPVSVTYLFPVKFSLKNDGKDTMKNLVKHLDNSDGAQQNPLDVKPTFQGGDLEEFSKWVNAHLEYPQEAAKNNIQGRVTLSFVLDEQGHLTGAKVLRGVDPLLDAEALRVVSSSPDWTPAMKDGKPAKITYIFPVIFKLKGDASADK